MQRVVVVAAGLAGARSVQELRAQGFAQARRRVGAAVDAARLADPAVPVRAA